MVKTLVVGENMKINSVFIENIGNIECLELNFDDRMNVICGSNGIGKTTILNSIAACFSNSGNHLKKKFGSEIGRIKTEIKTDNQELTTRDIKVESIKPQDEFRRNVRDTESYKKIINISIERNIDYREIRSLSKLPQRDFYASQDIINKGIDNKELKNWLINRYMSSGHPEDLSESELNNYELMKNIFSIINPDISFYKADARDFEILLHDRGNEVYFEYESSGFKSLVFILLGIVSEIEYRYRDISAKEFDGIVLIDEVDMHLHPSWQREVVRVLKDTFPNVQFILTTHSPSVLQNLENNEFIALNLDENKVVRIKELNLSEHGLKGWTLEEILEDIMDVNYIESLEYIELKKTFEESLQSENYNDLRQAYNALRSMLHPRNPLHQILEIQMAGIPND